MLIVFFTCSTMYVQRHPVTVCPLWWSGPSTLACLNFCVTVWVYVNGHVDSTQHIHSVTYHIHNIPYIYVCLCFFMFMFHQFTKANITMHIYISISNGESFLPTYTRTSTWIPPANINHTADIIPSLHQSTQTFLSLCPLLVLLSEVT